LTHSLEIPWSTAGVMGIGASGSAAAGFLARRGVRVVAADSGAPERLAPAASALQAAGVSLRLGPSAGADPAVFEGCEIVITSPGVPARVPPLAEARRRGTPVIAEVELAARFLRGVLIGVTGSNGKSTVTALTGRILQRAGLTAWVCGNIGTPLTEVAEADLGLSDEEARRVHYVVELSSFQLEGIETLSPRIGVLLNLSPDHQDRYAGPEEYYAAKERIFMNQAGDDVAIVNWDDTPSIGIAGRLAARLFPFSLTQDLEEGAVMDGGRLVLRHPDREETIMDVADVALPGRHNLENVLASASIATHCGVPVEAIARGVAGFGGLPHRLEKVGEHGGVRYYNDSKATNVGAAMRALEAFETPLVLLLGGYDKGGDFESLAEAISRPGRVRALVTFGKAGDDIARRLEGAAPKTVRAGALAEAVRAAAGCAQPGDIVLLAPACASFDAYTGYEKRGEDFRAIVGRLASQTGGLA